MIRLTVYFSFSGFINYGIILICLLCLFECTLSVSVVVAFMISDFYAPQLYRQVTAERVLAMAILSVCLSVCPSVTTRYRIKPR